MLASLVYTMPCCKLHRTAGIVCTLHMTGFYSVVQLCLLCIVMALWRPEQCMHILCRIRREEPVHAPLLPQSSPSPTTTQAPVVVVGRSVLPMNRSHTVKHVLNMNVEGSSNLRSSFVHVEPRPVKSDPALLCGHSILSVPSYLAQHCMACVLCMHVFLCISTALLPLCIGHVSHQHCTAASLHWSL